MAILKIAPHKVLTLVWWSKHRDEIDFNPPYQRRGRLWSQADKAYLIDTIINGFDVPKLYLADFQFGQSRLNSKRLPYAIIDGKQRLDAIFGFFDNEFPLAGNFVYRKNPLLKLSGLSLKDLKKNYPHIAEEFENASVDIMSVVADDERDINEIFVRLNRSKPLTGAEVRNAIVGPVPAVIRALASHAFFLENIRFSAKRAGDQNAVAKVLYFEYLGKLAATKKSNLDDFAKDERIEKSMIELASRRVIDTLDAMSEIFIPKDELLSSSGTFPVYYWFIRNQQEGNYRFIREFLVNFEAQRVEFRQKAQAISEDTRASNAMKYESLNRSTNDLQSHIGRVAILESAFVEWLLVGGFAQ